MNLRTTGLLFFLLLLPALAFASGNDIIPTIFLMGGLLVLGFGALLFVRLPLAEKGILAVVYLLTLWAVLGGDTWLPFLHNLAVLNLTLVLVPASLTAAVGFLLQKRRRQRGKQ